MSTIQYSDPLFEELLSRVPKDQMRTSSLSFGIASRIIEIMERRGWLHPQMDIEPVCIGQRMTLRKNREKDVANNNSRQGRPRGGEATEWHPREPQAPEGKGSATLKFCTAVRLKCWGH